jgi:hypothetical protein
MVGEFADVLYSEKAAALLALNETYAKRRQAAMSILWSHSHLDKQTVSWLMRRLKSETVAEVRRAIVVALGKYYSRNIGDASVRKGLFSIAEDSHECDEVRREARFAIKRPDMSFDEIADEMREGIGRARKSLGE